MIGLFLYSALSPRVLKVDGAFSQPTGITSFILGLHRVADPYSFDTNPDPLTRLNPDPIRIWIRIRIH
jgi:hypothetical protein